MDPGRKGNSSRSGCALGAHTCNLLCPIYLKILYQPLGTAIFGYGSDTSLLEQLFDINS